MKHKTHPPRSRITENIAAVAQSVEETPVLSNPRRFLIHLGIPYTSLQHILHKDLSLKAHQLRLTQELKPADHQPHRVFVDWDS